MIETTTPVQMHAQPSIDDVVATFEELPTLAPVALEVVRLADAEDTSIADITNAISRDPGLASRMLRLVNSALYSPSRPITSLNRATAMLGIRTVKLVSLGFTLVESLSAGSGERTTIFRHALISSVVGRRLAAQTAPVLQDDAFIAGLLGAVGKVAVADYPGLANPTADDGGWLSPRGELDLLGFTTAETGARILESWGMPAPVVDAVRHVADPFSAEAGHLAAVHSVADAVAFLLVDPGAGRGDALNTLVLRAASYLGITLDQIEELVEGATPELDEIGGIFEIDLSRPETMTDLVNSAHQVLVRLTLGVSSDLVRERQRNQALEEDNSRLATAAATDPLTGLANRRTFDAFLDNQIQARLRHDRATALGLLLVDMDRFKSINDAYGHQVGDEVLQAMGRLLEEVAAPSELIARIGGEEFALVLPDTSIDLLGAAGERIRSRVANTTIPTSAGELTVTVSVGGSYRDRVDESTARELYTTADSALYDSKHSGRNRVTVMR